MKGVAKFSPCAKLFRREGLFNIHQFPIRKYARVTIGSHPLLFTVTYISRYQCHRPEKTSRRECNFPYTPRRLFTNGGDMKTWYTYSTSGVLFARLLRPRLIRTTAFELSHIYPPAVPRSPFSPLNFRGANVFENHKIRFSNHPGSIGPKLFM